MIRNLFLLLLCLNTSVYAADFVFSVPVKLDRIPKGIPQAKVVCEIFTYRDTQNAIASGYTIKPIDSKQGFLYQDIEVNVSFHSNQRHQKPHQYQCQLQLLVPWTQPTWQVPGRHAATPSLRPRNNSNLVTSVSGMM